MLGSDGRRQDLSRVLAEEIEAIKGPVWVEDVYGAVVPLRDGMATAGAHGRQRDPHPDRGHQDAAAERAARQAAYGWAHQQALTALCLSGGGIRSSAVSLGVIQALADKELLHRFNYLSTVSGGGYIGAWLSAWLHHSGDADAVLQRLRSTRNDTDRETAPLAHLRAYSSYLTPKVGVFSADTWTALVIMLRNILVNWMILIPAVALLVIAVKLIARGLAGPGHGGGPITLLSVACLILAGLGFGYKLFRLYRWPAPGKPEAAQRRFLWLSLLPIVLAGLCFVWLALHCRTPAYALIPEISGYPLIENRSFCAVVLFAAIVYAIALAAGLIASAADSGRTALTGRNETRRWRMKWQDYLAWAAGVLVFAMVVWGGACIIGALDPSIALLGTLCDPASGACGVSADQSAAVAIRSKTAVAILGMPWFLLSTLLAQSVYLLLRSGSRWGDVEREWLGRASGWHFIAALAWILLTAVVLLGPTLYDNASLLGDDAGKWLSALTAASGTATALLGKSGLTPAQGPPKGPAAISATIALAIAGPLFAVLLLILVSVVVDQQTARWGCSAVIVVLAGVLVAADWYVNINTFSLHGLYRNRLIRAFLGGARAPHRHPDGFTDFDWCDDLRVASLWEPGRLPEDADWRPFHVINMTLNLADARRLAWQERKAMPFSVTPFSCGNADLGYRPTGMYGGREGISLGTAMAISGAAVSSNMGYNSSPALSFLLTFFNVRLGVWLGNPGKEAGRGLSRWPGAPYRREGPLFAVRPLLSELFGLTSADSAYVNLSDGGHFEDLGLYEMVRRRCRWIVVCDADEDPNRGFADLGNAVRKIWIDLGVRIGFADSPLLQASADDKPAGIPYLALGTIEYLSDRNPDGTVPTGKILYLKPVVRGDEAAADVIAYKRANAAFPDQSTANQWFDESQLESYRRLGYLMARRIFDAAVPGADTVPGLQALFEGIERIDLKTLKPPATEPDT